MKKFIRISTGVISLLIILTSCSDLGEPELLYPQMEVDITSVDFSTSTVGTTQIRDILIYNTGEADLNGDLSLVQDGTVFTLNPQGSFNLAPDDTLSAELQFMPDGEMTFSATLEISSDDPDQSELNISVSGAGTEMPVPVLSVSTNQIDFGTILSNGNATSQISLSNTGSDTLIISAITASNAVYLTEATLPITLLPGGSVTVNITFIPAASGVFNETLTITSNSVGSPFTLTLLGTSEAAISYSATVQPVWDERCAGCHGNNGGLSLGSYSQLMAGNSNNGPIVIPSNGAGSYLIKKLRGEVNNQMPQGGPFLSASTLADIEKWIDQGALDN